MNQAPLWLPYRMRQWIDQARIDRAVRGVAETKPYVVADPGSQPDDPGGAGNRAGDAEVHLLLCKRDLRIGVVAVKSLLRYGDGRLALTITDDGTLTNRDRVWVDKHLPGVRWLSWPGAIETEAALEAAFENRPQLKQLYHRNYAPAAKLLHPILLARRERVIVMDPDTAFFEPPGVILDWLQSSDPHGLYLHDHQDESEAVPPEARHAFADLEATLTPPGRKWGLPLRLFNSGLLVFRPQRLNLDIAERYLDWHRGMPAKFKRGKAQIWFGDWTPEQTCYHVMFALADPPPKPLGDNYHLGGETGHVFNHFLRHYLVRKGTLDRLRTLVEWL